MAPQLSLAADPSSWIIWLVPAVALSALGLGFFVGRRRHGASPVVIAEQSVHGEETPDQDEAYWEDRRSSSRHRVRQLKVLLSDATGQAPPSEGWLMNRSLGGLGLSVSESVEPGTILTVRQAAGGARAPSVRVEVRYCRMERGRWTLGCKFIDEQASNSGVFG
jgi:hypothetical protein